MTHPLPRPAGPLADILARRRVAIGVDDRQRPLLARPDSLLVRVGTSQRRRDHIASWVQPWDHDQAEWIAAPPPDEKLRVTTVHLSADQLEVPDTTSLAGVLATRRRLRAAGHHVELNHVLLGAPSLRQMLGAPGVQAGDVVLAGQAVVTAGGPVLRTTAEPSSPPRELRAPLQLPRRQRRPPKVLVMDSGLRTLDGLGVAVEHPDLESCVVHSPWLNRSADKQVDDEDETDVDETGTLDFQAGHGTFIAGIIRQYCPDAEIYTCGTLTSFGEGSVSGVLHALRRVLAIVGRVDVAVMSFGGYFTSDDPGVFGTELRRLLGDAVAVGSAGNDASCRPYFPAALPDVIGVGGLDAGGRAWFSNFGPWVDACAPAVDVVSTFFDDFTERLDGEALRHFDGWARWSGTSFAAPKVAALIAQERYLHGGTPREAWHRLTSHRHLRHADLGTVCNV